MSTACPLYQVDAFTHIPLHGNPAAICLLPGQQPDDWYRGVAREMNLSETAFVVREEDGFRLRWFTPAMEVVLCGHATLAAAHILWEDGVLRPEEDARFHTLSGLLTARQQSGWIELNFPSRPPQPAPEISADLGAALGVQPVQVSRFQEDYFIEVASAEEVRAANPDFEAVRRMARLAAVTSRGEGDYDIVSRVFAPRAGVYEDPVTGSAHTCLTPYWAKKLGKNQLLARQASARGGDLRLRLEGDRVILAGQAVTVVRGVLKA